MPRPGFFVPARLVRRLTAPAPVPTTPAAGLRAPCPCPCRRPASKRRLFSTSPTVRLRASVPLLGSGSSTNPPQPPIAAYKPQATREPAALTDKQYHALADDYLDRLLVQLEDMQDAREDVDVEYASGVLTLTFAPSSSESTGGRRARTYVINKQPPNKQIWLSSPVSGPKRFDWVTGDGEGDSEGGRWIYLKDNTAFDDLLREEIGVVMD